MKQKQRICWAMAVVVGFVSFSVLGAEEIAPEETPAVVAVLKQDGSKLPATECRDSALREEFSGAAVSHSFQYKDQNVLLETAADRKNGWTAYRIRTPLLRDGTVTVGFRFPGEKRLPNLDAAEKQARFAGVPKSFGPPLKAYAMWSVPATLVSPKPRRELKIQLAEYGATDRWKDVTKIVNNQLSCDSLDFRPNNILFGGDPAPGVVKSLLLTYSIDDDETLGEYRENSVVRLQFDSRDQYYRFLVQDADEFEFVIGTGDIPEKVPTFDEVKRAAVDSK